MISACCIRPRACSAKSLTCSGRKSSRRCRLALGLGIIAAVVAINAAATLVSLHAPLAVHRFLSPIVDPLRSLMLHNLTPVANYPASDISPYFRVNGYPPTEEYPRTRDDRYIRLQKDG